MKKINNILGLFGLVERIMKIYIARSLEKRAVNGRSYSELYWPGVKGTISSRSLMFILKHWYFSVRTVIIVLSKFRNSA